jgi:hypothetical protein
MRSGRTVVHPRVDSVRMVCISSYSTLGIVLLAALVPHSSPNFGGIGGILSTNYESERRLGTAYRIRVLAPPDCARACYHAALNS